MLTPAFPTNEAERLVALRALAILDTLPEVRFDRITAFARELFQVPIALISLIDHDRQWFKSKAGLDVPQTPREVSFCGHAILYPGVFVIEDATTDPRFCDNPLVTGKPFVHFYAGMPLKSRDACIGTLCLFDHKPRHFDEHNRDLLTRLAAWAERELTFLGELQITALRLEDQARLEAVLEGIVEGVVTSDLSGRIETANAAAGGIFRCDREEILGRNINELLPERDRSKHGEYMRGLNQQPDPLTRNGMEVTGQRCDGTEFPAEISFSRINLGARQIYSGILRDISERKELERAKSEFVSTVSHELRTPLTAIVGALGMLESELAGPLPEQVREFVAMAQRNSVRLSSLVDDILDIEKLQSAQMSFKLEMIDIAGLLAQVVDLNQGYASHHNVRLELDVAQSLPMIRIDQHRMVQVLTNLVSNAIKHSPEGEVVFVRAIEGGGQVSVGVEDHGAGIPEDFRAQVFERFSQADSTDARKANGTGLGLHIAKALVEHMAGEISFETISGTGTIFRVCFPVASAL